MAQIGKYLDGQLPAKMKLKHRTSLHHPYRFNSFSVNSIRVYFARPDGDRRALKRHLGPALGKDLDPNYTHVMLVVEIDVHGITVALRIHQKAWWDGQNLKKKCEDKAHLREFVDLLNQQREGFYLSIHDWKKEYTCGQLAIADLENYFQYYTPGEHWLHLRQELSRESEEATSEEFLPWCWSQVEPLVPLYRFIAWSPKNNYLF